MIDLSNIDSSSRPNYSSWDYAKMIKELNITEEENRLMDEILKKEASHEDLENREKYYLYLDIREILKENRARNKAKLTWENYHRWDNLNEEERIMKNIEDGNGELHGL
jgi:hypothetical protein